MYKNTQTKWRHIAISWWFCKNMCWNCHYNRFGVYNKKNMY